MSTGSKWGIPRTRVLGLVLAGVALSPAVRADIGVVVADPTTIGVSWFTHAGHSLVYLSGVCADGPVRARLCRAGELGSVVTMYPDFYEERGYAWNIVPLTLYLEGIEQPGSRLLYASPNVKAALELHARVNYLWPVCGTAGCPQREHAYWRDLAGATVDRDIFIYAVHTSTEQDETLVRWLNASGNQNAYNSVTNNCSNFTASLVNTVFPHSVHRDLLNDLGMMSPKGAARSFTLWSAKRPDLGLYAMHFAQQPGPMPRAGLARSGTEDGFHMKKYMIPAVLIGDHEVAGSFLVSYYLTGQFGLYKQYARHALPSPIVEDDQEMPGGLQPASMETQIPRSSEATVGTRAEWRHYRAAFIQLLATPEAKAWAPTPRQTFPPWFATAEAYVDAGGEPYLTTGWTGSIRTVGLSSDDLLSASSDPQAAFELMMGRVAYMLAAKNHYRESMVAFRQDWALLMAADQRLKGADATPAGGGSVTTLTAER